MRLDNALQQPVDYELDTAYGSRPDYTKMDALEHQIKAMVNQRDAAITLTEEAQEAFQRYERRTGIAIKALVIANIAQFIIMIATRVC